MSAVPGENRAINVSEDRMRGVIAEFELRFRDWLELKLEHKADLVMLNALRHEMADVKEDVRSLDDWRTAQLATAGTLRNVSAKRIAVWAIAATVVVGVFTAAAGFIAQLFFS